MDRTFVGKLFALAAHSLLHQSEPPRPIHSVSKITMANASLTNSRTADPLLQPFAIRHLKLKNRVFSTSHEPGYSENGMPTGRYQRYHIEKAKGGIAMTMIAGSAVVSADSPQAFGNLLAYKDEIVPHLKTLVDGCHDHDCKVMIQITHLGRRTNWHKADWLPVIAPSAVREEAHRAFPKVMEEWDIERVIQDFVDTAVRMKASGMDGIELMMHGHIVDSFWSPAPTSATTNGAVRSTTACGSRWRSSTGSGRRSAAISSSARGLPATRTGTSASAARKASRFAGG